MKFRKLKSFYLENKKLTIRLFTKYFHYISHSLFFGAKVYKNFAKCYSKFLIDVVRLEFGKLFNRISISMVFKRSRSSMFYKIGVLNNFAEFAWKRRRSVTDKKRLQCKCFPENFPKFLRITCLQNTSGRLLLDIFIYLKPNFFCNPVN